MKIRIEASGVNTSGSTFIEIDGDRQQLVYEIYLNAGEAPRLRVCKYLPHPGTQSPMLNEDRSDLVRECREFVLVDGSLTISGGEWVEIQAV